MFLTEHSLLREQDLAGKVAVITGSSRGIGRAIAINLGSRGCSVLGTYSQDSSDDEMTLLSHAIQDMYDDTELPRPRIQSIKANILSGDCAQKIADRLEDQFSGRVDIFINNAADSRTGIIGDLTVQGIEESLRANITTPVLIVDEFVKRELFQPDSRIIYISSIRSRQPWSEQLMYAAGKSAGESLCRTWSMAFGGHEEKVISCDSCPTVSLNSFFFGIPFIGVKRLSYL